METQIYRDIYSDMKARLKTLTQAGMRGLDMRLPIDTILYG